MRKALFVIFKLFPQEVAENVIAPYYLKHFWLYLTAYLALVVFGSLAYTGYLEGEAVSFLVGLEHSVSYAGWAVAITPLCWFALCAGSIGVMMLIAGVVQYVAYLRGDTQTDLFPS
jgi:hypothetical protein